MATGFQHEERGELAGSRYTSWCGDGSRICSDDAQWWDLPRLGDIFHFGASARRTQTRALRGWSPITHLDRACDVCLLAFLRTKKRLGRSYGVSRIVDGSCKLPSCLGMVLVGGPSVDPISLARSQRKSGPRFGDGDFHCLFGGARISPSGTGSALQKHPCAFRFFPSHWHNLHHCRFSDGCRRPARAIAMADC